MKYCSICGSQTDGTVVHYCNPVPAAQLTAQLSAVTAERDALAKALCYLIGEDWPDAGGDTESEKAMSVAIDKQAAELSELREKVQGAIECIKLFDHTAVYDLKSDLLDILEGDEK